MGNAVAGVVRSDEVRAAWRAIAEPGLVYEIRALEATTRDDRYPRELSGYFNDVEAVARALATVTSAVGVYVTMNPVKPDLRARADNRLKAAKKGMATADAHVVSRRFLLLDVDPRRESNISSTDDEHESAIELATLISKELGEEGWPEPVLADSGNGAHLLYRVDLPADDGGIVERAVKVLAKRFSDDALEVDTSVFNASRIVRLYGTKACKGDDTPDLGRVHRFSRLKLVPDPLVAVPQELLKKVGAPLLGATPPPARSMPTPSRAQQRGLPADSVERCKKYIERMPQAISGQKGHNVTFQAACECVRFDLSDAEAWEVMTWFNDSRTGGERWTDAELRHKLDDAKKKVPAGDVGMRTRSNGHAHANGQRHPIPSNGNGHSRGSGRAVPRPDPVAEGHDDVPSDPDQAWGDPIVLEPAPPPRMPSGVFTGAFGNFAQAVAQHTETPFEFAAVIGLACCAATVQGRVSLLVEHGYFEPLSTWVLPAMESGSRKSSVVKLMKRPLIEWDRAKEQEFKPQVKKVKSQIDTRLAHIKKLREEAAKKKDVGYELAAEEIARLEAEMPELPNVPRLTMDDATPEHTATIMSQNNERIAIIDSEPGASFGQLQGRYSKNGVRNIDIYLKSYDGSDLLIERGSRPAVRLWHPMLTIGVSPQPSALKQLVADKEFRGRGLLARFLYALCDANLGERQCKSWPIPPAAQDAYAELMTDLANLPPNYVPDEDGEPEEVKVVPWTLRLSHPAHDEWTRYRKAVEAEMRGGGRLERLRDWAGKLPGNVARLAGLLHCLDHGPGAVLEPDIPVETMFRAVSLGEYFTAHAVATFNLQGPGGQEFDTAAELWATLQRDRRSPFQARDAWMLFRNREGMGRMRDFWPVIELLVEHNLIARARPPKNEKGGCPPNTYEVHPRFADDWQ